MTDEFLTVAEGLPDEPDISDVGAACTVPGPASFFDRLFASLGHAGVNRSSPVIESSTRDDEWEINKGFCGRKDVGIRFAEVRYRETSAVGLRCFRETYGLPGIQVRWEFFLEKAGQLGFATFRHNSLQVSFRDSTAQALFVETWEQVFDRRPVFRATNPGNSAERVS
jgi:hypothetical protein